MAKSAVAHWPNVVGEPALVMHRENTVFRVETTTGPAALRLHRHDYHSRHAIRSELDWMAYLSKNGISVPAPLPTKDGDLLLSLTDTSGATRSIDMLAWIVGEPLGASNHRFVRAPAQTCSIFHNIGAALAKLHIVSDQWQPLHGFDRHAWDREGLIGSNPFWGPFWTISGLSTQVSEVLVATRDYLRQDLDLLITVGLDYGLIHADLVRENILVTGTKINMIDFDDAGFGFRMFDIATALLKNRQEPNYRDIESALLAGYTRLRPLQAHELAALPLFTLLRALTYLGWAESRINEIGMRERQQRFVDQALDLSMVYLKNR